MKKSALKSLTSAALILPLAASSATAGGLADAIVETPPAVIEEVSRNTLPAWLLPAVGLVVVGALVTSSGGNDDDTPSTAPTDLDAKDGDEPES